MRRINQRALARARDVSLRIQEEDQTRKEMAKMPSTKKKTRAGFMDAPPDVAALRQAADEAIGELGCALDAVTAAADRNAKLDGAAKADNRRFPNAGGGGSR